MSGLGDIPEGSNVSWAPWNKKESSYVDTYDVDYTCFASKGFELASIDGNPNEDWKESYTTAGLDDSLEEAVNLAQAVLDYIKEPTEQKLKNLKHLAKMVKEDCSDWAIQDIEIDKV